MLLILAGLLIFGISHSITASESVKARFKARFGERVYHGLYRLLYNIIATLTIAPIALYAFTQGTLLWSYADEIRTAFIVIQVIGGVGLLISIAQIDGGQFMGTSQLRTYLRDEPLPLPPEPLQTQGVYALVRHPLYLFSLMVLWFIHPMTNTILAFNVGATCYFLIGSLYEERRMKIIFGDTYEIYRKQVPWLIPFTHHITNRLFS